MIFLKKPNGVGEWDGFPSVSVPPDRKPLSKEEEKNIRAELKENMRKILKETPVRKDPAREKINTQSKIG